MADELTLEQCASDLRRVAAEIRREGHLGWGNSCESAADAIDNLRAELARLSAVEAELKGLKDRIAAAPAANEVEWEAVKDGFWITTRTRFDQLPPEGSRFNLLVEVAG